MKTRTTNCVACRKAIFQLAETEYLKQQYESFQNSARSMAVFATCAVLMVMARRGRTKQYIQQLYDDMCFIFDTPEMFGKQITMTDVMHSLTRDYGIDWDKLRIHLENEKAYLTGVRKAKRGDDNG